MEKTLDHLCMGCMGLLDDPAVSCPACGWTKGTQNQAHQLIPGSILAGKYLVGRSLGQGGFGITYIAWDIGREEKVAVKEYYPGDNVTRERDNYTVTVTDSTQQGSKLFTQGRDRFFSEAQNLARFDSDPNIVSVKDFFQENGTAYIVMEFVEGRTLKQYLASLGRPMLLNDVIALLSPVAESLERVHSQGLLHRDISPDNIMITETGAAKLLDFGAARGFSLQGERSNTVNVKVGYAPKEQFQTHGEQGPWTDVYALAATVYNAITGVTPASTLDRWQGQDTLQRPTALGISLTPAQEVVLLKGMAVEHKQRYQTVRQFWDALKAAANPKGGATVRGTTGATGGGAVGANLALQLKAGDKGAWGQLLCVVASLWLVGSVFFSNAFQYQADRYLENPFLNIYLPAILSLICVWAYVLDFRRQHRGEAPKWLTDPQRRNAVFWVHIALWVAAAIMCVDADDILGITVVYGALTTVGLHFFRKLMADK